MRWHEIAGHIDDPLGRPGVFAHIDRLQPGDPIIVHETRSGLDARFSVTLSKTYTLTQAADPDVLTQMYCVGPVAGTWPQPSADGLSHLTLVTCAGTFSNRIGTHAHRQVSTPSESRNPVPKQYRSRGGAGPSRDAARLTQLYACRSHSIAGRQGGAERCCACDPAMRTSIAQYRLSSRGRG